MKKMMINMKTLVALLMAGAAVTSCSSDNEMDSLKAPAGKTYTMTVQATKGGDAMTRALADGGDGTLTATWATTENVYVKKGSDWATGSLKPQTAGASTTLKGTLSGVTFAADDELTLQFPKSGDITYAGQKGTLADIAAKYDYATATVTVKSVSGGDIIPEAATTTFQHQQAIVKFTLKNGDDALSATKLVVAVGSTEYEVNPESAASEIYAAIPGFTDQTVTLTATVGTDTYTCTTSSAKSFANGSFYRVTAKMAKQTAVPTGALSGKFTINATKQVYFSKGNLQATYNGTDWTWAFAANQWDYIGNAAGNTSINGNGTVSTSNVTVDLFGWVGASSTWTGAAQYGITSSEATDNTDGYGNNASEDLKSDWGNTIGSGWRTLTSDEWQYIFNTRTTTSGVRYAKATVNGKSGVILLPDDWSTSYYSLSSTNTANAAYTTNSITSTDWTNSLEAHGAVFLPAAGGRNKASVFHAGSRGFYWSSSPNTSDVYYAYHVWFDSGGLYPASYFPRYEGHSVRLVRDVAAPAPAPEEEFVTFSDGVKVATMNLGATTVAESAETCYGDYYAWGATEPFGTVTYTAYNAGTVTATTGHDGGYSQANAPYYSGSAYTKYTSSLDATLEAADDAVAANMPGWHMPTQAEMQTLFNACGGSTSPTGTISSDQDYPTTSGIYWVTGGEAAVKIGDDTYKVNGMLFVKDATHHVFFPAAGRVYGTKLISAGIYSSYWSSSLYLYTDDTNNAYNLNIFSSAIGPDDRNNRLFGFPVRPFKD